MMISREQVKQATACARLLKQDVRIVNDLIIFYGLYKIQTGYLITVALSTEMEILIDNGTESGAMRAYDLLVKGAVTPCTAADIWEDLQKADG